MKRSSSTQLKAAFLLIVFSLNTIVGFACTVGSDMNFSESHHGDENASLSHKHSEPHVHEQKAAATHKHDSSHSHDDTIKDHEHAEKAIDDCCTDEVIDFEQIDKRAPQSFDFNLQPVFFALFLSGSYHFDAYGSDKLISRRKFFARSYHPPIPEIRIAIQSFQI